MAGKTKITWYGQACFKLENSGGSLVIDPYAEGLGFPPLSLTADAAIKSHDHHDHNFLEAVTLTGKGGSSCLITAVDSYHDGEKGAKRGKNLIHVIESDGVRICHLGDLGHVLDGGMTAEIGKVDVLLIPVGGYYTIDAAGALTVTRQLEPTVVIPMHYKMDMLDLPISGVGEFLSLIAGDCDITELSDSTLEVGPDTPKGVYVLTP